MNGPRRASTATSGLLTAPCAVAVAPEALVITESIYI
jgi:hypothetical protein